MTETRRLTTTTTTTRRTAVSRTTPCGSRIMSRDMILDPQGVVLETAVRLVVVVVVVNLLVSVMAMIVITAVKMVLQLVRPLRVRVVRHGNQRSEERRVGKE